MTTNTKYIESLKNTTGENANLEACVASFDVFNEEIRAAKGQKILDSNISRKGTAAFLDWLSTSQQQMQN